LLPNNRIRLLVSLDFSWLPDGPIQRFKQQAHNDTPLALRPPRRIHGGVSGVLCDLERSDTDAPQADRA
jgi:hypothetical protein